MSRDHIKVDGKISREKKEEKRNKRKKERKKEREKKEERWHYGCRRKVHLCSLYLS